MFEKMFLQHIYDMIEHIKWLKTKTNESDFYY